MPISLTTQRISSREWANRKSRIHELYIRDGRTLTEIMREMTKEGFPATKSQYEHQFKMWGWRKNRKQAEWAKTFQERQQGDTAPIILSGRVISDSRVETARRRYAHGGPLVPELPVLCDDIDSIRENAAPRITTEDLHGPIQDFALDTATAASQIHTETNDLTFGHDILPFEYPSEPPVLFHGGCNGNGTGLDGIDPINSVNFDLQAQRDELALTTSNYSPTPFPIDLLTPNFLLGQLPIQAVGWTASPTSPNPNTFNAANWHGHPWSMNRWIKPLPAIQFAAMLTKDIYSNIQSTPEQNMIHIVWQLSVCVNESTRGTRAFPSAFERLLSEHNFVGEEPNQFAMSNNNINLEARLYARLISSLINGFSGLSDIPADAILRFLNRHAALRHLMLKFLESNSSPVAKSLAENIFQSALETDNVEVVRHLLDHTKLINANETVCSYRSERCTPLEKAAAHRSLKVIKLLLSRGVDVNKSFSTDHNVNPIQYFINSWSELAVNDEFLGIIDTFLKANAKVTASDLSKTVNYFKEDPRVLIRLIQACTPQALQQSIQGYQLFLKRIAEKPEKIAVCIGYIIKKLRESGCDTVLHRSRGLDYCLKEAVNRGYDKVVRTLLPYTSSPERALRKARKTGNKAMINMIIETDPDKDMKCIKPLLAALKSGDQNQLRSMERDGVFKHLQGNRRLGTALVAALEAGNLNYSIKILNIDPYFKVDSDNICDYIEAFRIALIHDFDDIAWELLAAVIAENHGRECSFWALKAAILSSKTDFVKAVVESNEARRNCETWLRTKSRRLVPLLEHAIGCNDKSILADILQFDFSSLNPESEFIEFALDNNLLYGILESRIGQNRGWLKKTADFAIESGNIQLLDKLVDLGAELDDGLLRKAVEKHPSMVKPFLERFWKVYPQGRPGYGRYGILAAIGRYLESPEILDAIFDFKLMTTDILQGDGWCETPLGRAVRMNPPSIPLITRLLGAGSDVNCITVEGFLQNGTTAFLEAIDRKSVELIRLFIQHDADINKPARSGLKWTPLQKAAEKDSLEIVCLLLDGGADANAPPGRFSGATALQLAAIHGNCEMVRELIGRGARLDIPPPPGKYGRWPLEGAAENGRLDMIQLLWDLNGGPFDERQCQRAITLAECDKASMAWNSINFN
ncbi:hypothetical protein F4806DRAFT_497734 [Annulohypoxylon nitens]|nr:hypothetical protein F4806DRAFT_497734 [Annulohypoxylon nitens]